MLFAWNVVLNWLSRDIVFDVRRWMIAEETENKQMHGFEITKSITEKGKKVPVRKHTFRKAMYFLPIPYKETVKSDDLVQNPYYE